MQLYRLQNECEQFLYNHIMELKDINERISELNLRKEQLSNNIISALGHDKAGQKTYEYMKWKIEVKTPIVYSLDKKKYESIKHQIPKNLNPVKESISYSIDKRLCDEYISKAPENVQECLARVIETKPGKINVLIKENT